MIPKEVYNYSKPELIDWLRNEAGSSNPDYFHAQLKGGLKLQQVPEEFAELLLFLKERKIKDYLELGIGNGGSFETICFFLKQSLQYAIAVDSLVYGALINQTATEIKLRIDRINKYYSIENVAEFINKTTDDFFKTHEPDEAGYDAIFIDADHSYDAAKRDFENAIRKINKGGVIIFHDINSAACPGIMKLWNEIKQGRKNWEFISSKTCGIGVIEIN